MDYGRRRHLGLHQQLANRALKQQSSLSLGSGDLESRCHQGHAPSDGSVA